MEATPKKPWFRRWFGTRSERAAARYLRGLGYRILKSNFTCPLGELDLIALDGPTVVFVEVRSTATADCTRPAQSVDAAKERRLSNLALYYLKKHRLIDQPARFDVLAMSWPMNQRQPSIVHLKNAFEAVGRFQMHS